jgi:hypothetical protein
LSNSPMERRRVQITADGINDRTFRHVEVDDIMSAVN